MNFFEYLFAKKMGGEGGEITTQTKEATPSESEQDITPDSGKLLSKVTVHAIPSSYKDTSDATGVAADLAEGKTMYGPSGKITGTNDYVKPAKGVVVTEWNTDGIPITIETVGFTAIPNDAFKFFGYEDGNGPKAGSIGKISKIELNEGITSFGYGVFLRCIKITELTFPATAYTYGDQLCRYCTALKEVTYKGDVNVLWWGSYLDSGLEKITFNGNVNRLQTSGNNRTFPNGQMKLFDFSHCTAVPILDASGIISDAAYSGGCTIKVPQSLLEDWQDETNWCDVSGVTWEGV